MKLSAMRPVAKQSAESLVTDSLREFILSGSIKPGDRLTEIALAEHMGVARATLRTGLHRLAAEGIVTQIPYTGWEVAKPSAQDAWELWTLRAGLESLAAKLAAQAPASRRSIIGDAYAALLSACQKGSMKKISEADFATHRAIVMASDHVRLQQQYRLVEQQVRLFIFNSNMLVEDGGAEIVAQHKPIVDAILAGDGEKAARLSWAHNEQEGKKLVDWMSAQD